MDEDFDVVIKKDRFGIHLSVTHNGYQWSTISFNNDEELVWALNAINDHFLYKK